MPVPVLRVFDAHGAPQSTVAQLSLPQRSYFVLAKAQVDLHTGAAPLSFRAARAAGAVIEDDRPQPLVCQLAQLGASQPQLSDRLTLSTGGLQSLALQIHASITSTAPGPNVALKCDLARRAGTRAARKAGGAQLSQIKVFAIRTG
ncbi:MAG: hypothetical protein ACYC91_02335 [Solirubrobacteraceae bacterium]